MLERYPQDVKLVIKHFPLRSHAFARQAAAAALAAARQGKFWEMHKALFENYDKLDENKVQELAREVGLDLQRLAEDSASQAVQALIDRDLSEGQALGVKGTPTIFINGKIFSQGNIFEVIEDELAGAADWAATGKPCRTHSPMPWRRLYRSRKPFSCRIREAAVLRLPLRQ